jgi:hypothetical protein
MEVTVNTLSNALLAIAVAMFLLPAPAHAQFMQGQSGGDMMTMMAPMMGMMKKKMGKRRFAQIMRTVGPMAVGMMNNGGGMGAGLGGGYGGMGSGYGGPGGGGYGAATDLSGAGYGGAMPVGGTGFDVSQMGEMSGMGGMEQIMSSGTIQSLIGMATSGRGGRKARRHRT